MAEILSDPAKPATLTWLRSPATPSGLPLGGPCGRDFAAEPKHQMVITNAALIRTMLQYGGCFALFPEFIVRGALAAVRLGTACAGWSIPVVGLHGLYIEHGTALTNARAFFDQVQTGLYPI